ncbi:MAG TPA: pseudouridine-5'-phosphate glycosidase [Ignavibacteria bacterium]|nr:pseudouridine-5-phosphate glycosidase [Bacteroidota bacterium]HRI86179.1 pseudouridine-5'-phosphate glycosidase [Ignavibacteria bacterium]HRK00224.1 pseudouridine-5'-phosphate glycosidase [Ignavibacteria bacterium]
MSLSEYLIFPDEVKSALERNEPVVALESTIISHGMPYPKNLETALEVEKTVRDYGAVPATIAVINGKIKAGLSVEDLEILSKGKDSGTEILKASRRDIPYIISRKLNAATTVSATMIFAEMARLKIFATGGIGGVHRNADKTFDISADLTELAQTEVAVVSAGVKSILDLGLTLEYLETLGVPVIGYGTDEFPAFYTRVSGYKVNYRLDTPEEIAAMINVKKEMGLKGGMIIANPVPEEYSMNKEVIDKAIEEALTKADKDGIKGKDITPFLLAEIQKITDGKSLDTNIKLVINNAKLAAEIAVKLCR